MATMRDQVMALVTDAIREELVCVLRELSTIADREERLRVFSKRRVELSDEARRLLDLSSRKELQHIEHVRRTLAGIPDQPRDRLPHDFSKDDLYFLATSSVFDYRIDDECARTLFRMETERHFTMEPHHEQFEAINGRQLDEDDIREMAIDRLSRNIQANGGKVNMNEMMKYVPRFPLGDNDKKQAFFKNYVSLYKELAEKMYHDMFV